MRHASALRKGRRSRWLVALMLGLVVFVVCTSWMSHALVIHRPIPAPDAILSLGSHEWERLPVAARLARKHPAALVLLTEPPIVTPFNCHDCANRIDRLRQMGVAEERIRLLAIPGTGTHGEARGARVFASESGVRRLMIVTSPYHTRRSLAVFRKVFEGTGVDIGVAPAAVDPPIQPSRWWLAPYDRAYVPYEWAAIVYYWWEYGVPIN
ncbi:MAG TPA: YdcF family protein [Vicinamibacterales bacterium]|nr:YdcF family protein [Vicinamibacterales bacterium]